MALTRDPIITAKEVASLDLLSGPDGEEYALPGRRVEGREVAAVEHH
jgi:hypothetical protein